MSYQDRLARLRELCEEHNAVISEDPELAKNQLDIPKLVRAIKIAGGTTEDSLKALSYENLVQCGLPVALAKRAANEIFRAKKVSRGSKDSPAGKKSPHKTF